MKTKKRANWEGISKFIGIRLSILRKKKGFTTVKDFAIRYQLPEIQYWRMEKGKANLTIKSLSKVLDIHRISFEDFFCDMKLAA